MTDRLSLTNALAEANIERKAAERIATEIFNAVHENVATKADLESNKTELRTEIQALRTELRAEIQALRTELLLRISELEHRMTLRFGSAMVVLTGVILAAIRYLPRG